MFGAGPVFDHLQDRLRDMGAPPARYGWVVGQHKVWLKVQLPANRVETKGDTLEDAAKVLIESFLTATETKKAA